MQSAAALIAVARLNGSSFDDEVLTKIKRVDSDYNEKLTDDEYKETLLTKMSHADVKAPFFGSIEILAKRRPFDSFAEFEFCCVNIRLLAGCTPASPTTARRKRGSSLLQKLAAMPANRLARILQPKWHGENRLGVKERRIRAQVQVEASARASKRTWTLASTAKTTCEFAVLRGGSIVPVVC